MLTQAQYDALWTPEAIAQRAAYAEQTRLNNARTRALQNERDSEFINPNYNLHRGNVRYDHTRYGSGANALRTYADGRRAFKTYSELSPSQKGYENFQNFRKALKHNTGISDWNQASDRQLFEAVDDTFRGYQEDNKKENFSIGSLITQIAPAVAGSLLLPGVGTALGTTISAGAGGAIGGALAGGIRGGWRGAALGGLSGYGIGSGIGAGQNWLASRSLAAGQPFHAGALGPGFTSSSLYSPPSLGATGATGAGVTGLGGGAYTAGQGMMNASALFNPSVAANWASMPIGTAARYGNAVAGARTGINSALPGMGGGFTTAQGAGTAALRAPQTGLNRAIMNSGQSGAAASSPASWMGTSAASLYSPVSLGGTPSPTWMQRGMNALDTLMQSDVLSQIAGGNQAAAAGIRRAQRFLPAPGVGNRQRSMTTLPIPTTGIREALAQQAARRLQNTGLTRLTPIQSGLLRL